MKTREELLEEVIQEMDARLKAMSRFHGQVNIMTIRSMILDEVEDRDLAIDGLSTDC